jgi:hypothetical protein
LIIVADNVDVKLDVRTHGARRVSLEVIGPVGKVGSFVIAFDGIADTRFVALTEVMVDFDVELRAFDIRIPTISRAELIPWFSSVRVQLI